MPETRLSVGFPEEQPINAFLRRCVSVVEAFLDEVSLFKAAVVECYEWTLYTLSLTRRFLLLLQMDTTVCYI